VLAPLIEVGYESDEIWAKVYTKIQMIKEGRGGEGRG